MNSTSSLVIYSKDCFIKRQVGSHVRIFEQVRWAEKAFDEVVVFSWRSNPTVPWTAADLEIFRERFPRASLVLDDLNRLMAASTRLKNAALSLAPALMGSALRLHLPGVSPALDGLRANPARLFLVNYADGITQLNGVDPRSCVVETHDSKFLNFAKRTSRPLNDIRVISRLRNEISLLADTAAIIAISPPEASMFKLWFPDKPVFFVPQYPDSSPVSVADGDFVHDLLFVASSTSFNVQGIMDFIHANAAWLQGRTLAIAGKICAVPAVRTLAAGHAGIRLLGYVEDLAPLYATARVAICPVSGTGLKIKVVEALRHGRPVAASESAISGLPGGFERCVFPILPGHMTRLLDDARSYREASAAAVEYAASLVSVGDLGLLTQYLKARLEPDSEAQHATQLFDTPSQETR